MNILRLLILKKDVYSVVSGDSVRQAIEKMNYHHYQNIPILTGDGKYVNSVSSSDILAFIAEGELTLKDTESVAIDKVTILRPILPLRITATLEDVRKSLLDQNYVPMVDDQGIFIGIITRRRFVSEAMRLIDE